MSAVDHKSYTKATQKNERSVPSLCVCQAAVSFQPSLFRESSVELTVVFSRIARLRNEKNLFPL